MPARLRPLIAAFAAGWYDISDHGWDEMGEDAITALLLEEAIGNDKPEIIKDYPTDVRGPCCIVLGWTGAEGRPVHAVVGYGGSVPIVVTAWRPDLKPWLWGSNYRRRR